MQDDKPKAIAILSKIYDVARLQDEIDHLSVTGEDECQKRNDVKISDVFKSKRNQTCISCWGWTSGKGSGKPPYLLNYTAGLRMTDIDCLKCC